MLFLVFDLGVGYWDGRKKRFGVGMKGVLVEHFAWGKLHQFTEVHDGDFV